MFKIVQIAYIFCMASISILNPSITNAQTTGNRVIKSEIYQTGTGFFVTIQAEGEPGDITVIENPPDGWTIKNVSDNGQVNEDSIIWELISFTGNQNFRYNITPPKNVTGLAIFSGKIDDKDITGSYILRNQYVYDEITSSSLEGNLLGDPSTRNLIVYLPPSYYYSLNKRYPVFYFLHGYSLNYEFFSSVLQTSGGIASIADKLIESSDIIEAIIVMPDARNKYNGSYYGSNSVNGDYRNYIAHDLVNYIDNKYRTLNNQENRGIAGYSMGGYGALSIIMDYPNVFGAAAALSPGVSNDFEKYSNIIDDVIKENPITLKPPVQINVSSDGYVPRSNTTRLYALAAAFSPNPTKPYLVDLPIQYPEKTIVQEVYDLWCEHDLVHLIKKKGANLVNIPIYVSRGVGPVVSIAECTGIESNPPALEAQGISCTYEEFNGDHFSKIDEQTATALKFLSDAMVTTSVSLWDLY